MKIWHRAYRVETKLHEDYSYETDLQLMPILMVSDKYRQSSWAFPVGADSDSKFWQMFGCFSSVVPLLEQSEFSRRNCRQQRIDVRGSAKNEEVVPCHTSVSFCHEPECCQRYTEKTNINYCQERWRILTSMLAVEDADHDGVPDVQDDSSATWWTIQEGYWKAADTDDDGIPNYRDKEPTSAKDGSEYWWWDNHWRDDWEKIQRRFF